MQVSNVTLTHATIGDKTLEWDILCAAATQDHASNERDHRGLLVKPHGDSDLAETYRAILRSALPLIAESERAAYEQYCRVGFTSREPVGVHAAGHGSWTTGPDPDLQATWRDWQSLQRRITDASQAKQ